MLVRAAGDVDAAAAALRRVRPDVRPMTNEQVVGRVQRTGFTYFQQISAVLTTVTLGFALLLITVLLTVSVNQRLGEIAALRALGFSRARVVADVLCESVLIVGLGGALSLPLGVALANGLDRILTDMPGIPSGMHFFVFEPRALAWHGGPAGGDGDRRRAVSDAARGPAADRQHAAQRGGVLMPAPVIVRADRVTRSFAMPSGPVVAVRDVSLDIAAGDYLAVRGPSGCGKSTLLHMLGCVDTPSEGTLLFEGRDVAALSDRERSLLRLRSIGFVFQRFFLLPMLTAAENVELPQSEAGVGARDRQARTRDLLDYVGLSARADHRPSQLSGGEMQRVAIARALANKPRLLLADEPTGELDQATGEHVAELLDRVNRDGTALVIVTHDHTLASRARAGADAARRRRRKRAGAVIGRLALRSLTAHPVRSGVLAVGFGAGVAVMAILLGVAEVVLQQAQSPLLVGGGDVVVAMGRDTPASLLLAGTLQAEALRAPRACGRAHPHRRSVSVVRRRARASGRPRRHPQPGACAWRSGDAPEPRAGQTRRADAAWTRQSPAAALRQVDRFHPIPDAPAWQGSWAEWLYFNGALGDARFYLTFLVGPEVRPGVRAAGVRLQLERGGRMRVVQRQRGATGRCRQPGPEPDHRQQLSHARWLDLSHPPRPAGRGGARLTGDLTVQATPGRLVPPIEILGARGWRTGYVVPVMSGELAGTLACRRTAARSC